MTGCRWRLPGPAPEWFCRAAGQGAGTAENVGVLCLAGGFLAVVVLLCFASARHRKDSTMPRTPERLFHFTCHHSRELIDDCGVLRPNPHPWLALPVVWLTDLEDPPAEALFGHPTGLLACDRMDSRYEAEDLTTAVPWPVYARGLLWVAREALEAVPGSMPAHWWVSEHPVPVIATAVRL